MVTNQIKKLPLRVFYAFFAALLWAPAAFAETTKNFKLLGAGDKAQTPKTIADIACIVTKLALDFIPLIVAFAVVFFLVGLVKYMRHGDNEEKRSEGVKMMIYGTFGFFFLVSVWGIMRLAGHGLGFDLVIPQFKANQSFVCP